MKSGQVWRRVRDGERPGRIERSERAPVATNKEQRPSEAKGESMEQFLLNILGYLISCFLIILFVVVLAKFILVRQGKDLNTIFLGPIIKDFSEIIFNQARKFIPIEEESTLSIILLAIFVLLFWLVGSFIIK